MKLVSFSVKNYRSITTAYRLPIRNSRCKKVIMSNASKFGKMFWNYCNILSDEGFFYSLVEELESVLSANLQRATRLRQSFLQNASVGEL